MTSLYTIVKSWIQVKVLGQSHLNLVDFNEHFKISKLQGSQFCE